MEISEILARAWAEVENADLPPELHQTAFQSALALIADTGVKRTKANVGADATSQEPEGDESEVVDADPDELFVKFAKETGIDQSELEDVFFFHADGSPALNGPARKLGNTVTKQAQAVATALAAAGYFVADETSTPVSKVRAECDRLKCSDKKNFTRHMTAVPGVVLAGPADSRVLRVKAADILDALQAVVNTARGV